MKLSHILSSIFFAGLMEFSVVAHANWVVVNYNEGLTNRDVMIHGGDLFSNPDRAGKAVHPGQSVAMTLTFKNSCTCRVMGTYTQTAVEGMKGPSYGHWENVSEKGMLCDGEDTNNNNKAKTENNGVKSIGLLFYVSPKKCS